VPLPPAPYDAVLARLKTLHPRLIDLSLDRMRRLCAVLGDPQERLPPVVHIAGTNGKGSTAAFVRAIAEAAGLSVHVYTSPHLVRFAERIRVRGRIISDEALLEILDRVERLNAGGAATQFEITTAAAFLAFAETPADLAVVEVGLGGRMDATNVIQTAAVAAITPIGLDHQEFLGPTIAAIAAEKAGILRPGVACVVGRQSEAALSVLEAVAQRVAAPCWVMGRDFDAWAERGGMAFQGEDRLYDLPAPALDGPHQIDNAGLAIAAVLSLGDPRIDASAIARGLKAATWPARLQRLNAGPLADIAARAGADLRLDGGHNPHAAAALGEALASLQSKDPRPLALVCGMVATKDARGFFEALRPLSPRVLTVPFDSERVADPEMLAGIARSCGLAAEAASDLVTALQRAVDGAERAPRIVICGSLYLAGEALALSPDTWPG
jgi:dihydrofolate synthase/folylpolyglutamate synthase